MTVEKLREIVKNHSYLDYDWKDGDGKLSIDVQTANVMVMCYDALTKEATKTKFETMIAKSKATFINTAEFCWSRVK